MMYLNEENIEEIGIDWTDIISALGRGLEEVHKNQYSQPIKPYLRFRDPGNRIIAMPAFVGGGVQMAGIKWISSFPSNLKRGLKRAHSITVLNNSETGQPICFINSSKISGIRTAGVSGLVVNKYLELRNGAMKKEYKVGIIGFGPIGQLHYDMLNSLLGDRLEHIFLYDKRTIEKPNNGKNNFSICDCWEDVYSQADIFVTCTTSREGYIDKKPKEGSLQLNVSLRDYSLKSQAYMDCIVVDDWEEVCRENTDIERMHLKNGLEKKDAISLSDLIFLNRERQSLLADGVIMFNPMGLAVFDIITGQYYFEKARRLRTGEIID